MNPTEAQMCTDPDFQSGPQLPLEEVKKGINLAELENIFTYHAPKDGQQIRYEGIREIAKTFAIHIEKTCPNSREKSLALTKLRESVMWANAAIAINE